MNAETIARVLGGRRCGAGWVACCPAHEDRSPSLSVCDSGGKVLVHCHAGCDQDQVIAGLRDRGLWPEPERRQWTPTERRDRGRRRRLAEADALALSRAALWWYGERIAELSDGKAAAVTEDSMDVEALRFYAGELRRLQCLSAEDVLREYVAFETQHPAECAGLVRVGRIWQRACEAAVRAALQKIESEQGAGDAAA